jgi:hypothetical protein
MRRSRQAAQARRFGGGSPVARKRRRGRAGHPLLELQRTIGNQAVVELVQRQEGKKKSFTPALALDSPDDLYEGKCDADLKGPAVRKKWSRGLLGKETKVVFECGPESFEFGTLRAWFDDDHFPWHVETTDDATAWVTSEIALALDDIVDDMDDPGSKFWDGYHTVQSALKKDLERYCRD